MVLAGCPLPGPIVREMRFAPTADWMGRLAVMPFYAPPREGSFEGVSGWEAAALVSRFVSEALARSGVPVIPAGDLDLAFQGAGQVTPRLDGVAAAEVAARKFGATAVLTGQVTRYRERPGQALGTSRPASVGFELRLYTAPAGEKLWTARFDETQQPLSENVLHTRRYPGRGTRWLTAAELARWGVQAAVDALLAGR